VTAATGTSDKAVRDRRATGGGVEGSQGKKEEAKNPAPVIDKSRPAGLPVGANWKSCGFPPEADAEQINQAFVRVVVVVSASGTPTSVNVLSDPGYGFGRIAKRCAMRFKYPVGLDKMGNPTATATRPFMVRFTR
jgi:protein TonB